MDIPNHLLQRPSGFYFRLVIPKPLREHYGKTEIRRSLRTASRYLAAQSAKRLWSHYQIEFEGLGMAKNKWVSDAVAGQLMIGHIELKNGTTLRNVEVESAKDVQDLAELVKAAGGEARAEPETLPAPKYLARLSVLIPKFLDLKQKAEVSKDQYTKYVAALDLLAEIVGDKDVNHVTDRDVELVQDTLQKVPKHRNNSLIYQGKTLNEAIKLAAQHNKPLLNVSTVDFTLQKITAFFDWSRQKNHLAGINPFEKSTILSKQQRQKKSERTQFSPADLQAIFRPEHYQTIQSPSLYWLPLMALYTGARLGELAQLDLDDLRHVDKKIWCFYINKDGKPDKNLKSEAANRYIPVHQALIDLGFLAYAKEMQKAGHKRLFQTIFPSKKGSYAYTPSKEFAKYLDEIVGITEPGKVFHSFRYTAMDALRQEGLGVEMRCELAGQKHDNVNTEVYTNKSRVVEKEKAIAILHYDGLNLDHLKYRPRQFKDFIEKSEARRKARDDKAVQKFVVQVETARQSR